LQVGERRTQLIAFGAHGCQFSTHRHQFRFELMDSDGGSKPGQAIGRFGCLVTGDTVGRPTDGSWGVVYVNPGARVPQLGVAYQPAFFYEQLWDVLIFAILWRLRGRITGDGQLFALYLALYAVGKFAITFVRLDPVYISDCYRYLFGRLVSPSK
jgi:prolipoprotein diacylglyceryltransferase